MCIISVLVEKLRELGNDPEIDCYGINELNNVCVQAADTIEALSAKLAAANMERSERYYNGDEESYTVEQILDAITQADEEVISAIRYKDRDMLEDVLKDYLQKR